MTNTTPGGRSYAGFELRYVAFGAHYAAMGDRDLGLTLSERIAR